MDICEHITNIIASIIAIEYMQHSFDKKYNGRLRRLCFTGGCAVYFVLITVLNLFTIFEGILCVFYGADLTLYRILALRGNVYNKVFLSLMWVLNVLFRFLFSNGIEACLQAEGTRILDVILCAKDGKLKIRLENTISNNVLRDNPQLLSSKENNLPHGYGMQTIYSILEKYHERIMQNCLKILSPFPKIQLGRRD